MNYEDMSTEDMAREGNMSVTTVRKRKREGMTNEEIVTTELAKTRKENLGNIFQHTANKFHTISLRG